MDMDPKFLMAIGDVLLNLAAGWFGAAALAIGYKFRILGLSASKKGKIYGEMLMPKQALLSA